MKGPRWRRRLVQLACVAGALVLLYPTRQYTLSVVPRILDVSESPRRVDYVLVLEGNLQTRPFAAAALYRAHLTPMILTSEVRPSADAEAGLAPPEHELVRRIMLAKGVPAEAFQILPGACESTSDEARCLAQFLADKPHATVAVVTTDYHTRRSRWLFRRELGDGMANVFFVGVPTDGFTPDNWWCFEEGWTTYLHEYCKIVYHVFR